MTTTHNADPQPGPFDAVMEITHRPPIVFTGGKGSWLFDSQGRRYLDFIQGWAVNCLGHAPAQILQALAGQSAQLINCSPAYYNDQMIRLSDMLAHHSGLHRVFLANSGAEANEGAVKLARKWGAKYREGAYEIITMDHGFHGRTLAMMSASGKSQWEPLFEPKVSGFVKVPAERSGRCGSCDHGSDRRGLCWNQSRAKPASSRQQSRSCAICVSSRGTGRSC